MPRLSLLRRALLLGVALNLALIAIRVSLYRPLLAMPGALRFILEPVIGLAGCGLFVFMATSQVSIKRERSLWPATAWGIIGGALLVVHMALENFGARVGENGPVTLVFMFLTFFLWGVAGFIAARNTSSTTLGLLGGCWGATVSVILAVTFGFALMFFEVPSLDYVASWPEFKQSGWRDVGAFAIANSLEAGFTHLLAGLVLGSTFGAIGGGLARIWPGHASAKQSGA